MLPIKFIQSSFKCLQLQRSHSICLTVLNADLLLLASGRLNRLRSGHFDLGSQLSTLLSRDIASKNRRVTIEMFHDLFQRSVPRLDIELPYNEEFKQDPYAVENVIFPLQMIEGNGIDVLVEEERKVDCEPEDSSTLCDG